MRGNYPSDSKSNPSNEQINKRKPLCSIKCRTNVWFSVQFLSFGKPKTDEEEPNFFIKNFSFLFRILPMADVSRNDSRCWRRITVANVERKIKYARNIIHFTYLWGREMKKKKNVIWFDQIWWHKSMSSSQCGRCLRNLYGQKQDNKA